MKIIHYSDINGLNEIIPTLNTNSYTKNYGIALSYFYVGDNHIKEKMLTNKTIKYIGKITNNQIYSLEFNPNKLDLNNLEKVIKWIKDNNFIGFTFKQISYNNKVFVSFYPIKVKMEV